MVKKITLNAKTREELGKQAKHIREEGMVPAVLYGSKGDNINIKVSRLDMEKLIEKAGEAALIDLVVDGGDKAAGIIKEIQWGATDDKIKHIDFYRVDMNKPIQVDLPLEFTGEAPAVKELGGTLITNLDTLQAECLPGDLVESIKVDLSSLTDYDAVVKLSDLDMPKGITPLIDENTPLAHVAEPEKEEEPEPAGEEADEGAEGALEGEGEKKEGEDNKEGEDKKE